jgi:3-hydroxyisobutyrate dehydrogenase-like beta-hydroxyacid dehydrogenase
MDRIGIIGLGRMGSAMAQRLAGQGARVTGWTRSGLGAADAAEWGIARAETLADLIAASDAVLLSLFDDSAVAEVLDNVLAQGGVDGRLFIDTSTVAPNVLQSRIDRLSDAGASAVDAPISGGPELVLSGTCGIFLGGAPADVERALTVTRLISDRCFAVGPLGTGMVMKTVNTSMLQAYITALMEQLRLAKRAGLPLETAIHIVSGGPAGLTMVRDRIPKILGQDAEVGFTIGGILKDAQVFQRIAADYGVDTPSLALAEAMERAAVDAGLADIDPAHLIAHAYHSA